jgi:YHS domain-containing protein
MVMSLSSQLSALSCDYHRSRRPGAARPAARKGCSMVKDPVCGMMIDEKDAVAQSEYEGHIYYFCAQSCKRRFDEDPQRYAGRDR